MLVPKIIDSTIRALRLENSSRRKVLVAGLAAIVLGQAGFTTSDIVMYDQNGVEVDLGIRNTLQIIQQNHKSTGIRAYLFDPVMKIYKLDIDLPLDKDGRKITDTKYIFFKPNGEPTMLRADDFYEAQEEASRL